MSDLFALGIDEPAHAIVEPMPGDVVVGAGLSTILPENFPLLVLLRFLPDVRLKQRLDAAAADGPAPAAGNARVPLSMEGKINLPLLMAVIGAVFLPTPWREMAMAAAAVVSVWKTPAKVREENEFTWHPIEEVAILFAGIFATMIPALLILKARGAELGVVTPAHFFWATGMLSSFLDNAPTYLTFFSLAQGVGGTQTVAGVSAPLLQAISAGAVFIGAFFLSNTVPVITEYPDC